MPILNSFLGCFDLISGGVILGWSTVLSRSVTVLLFTTNHFLSIINIQSGSSDSNNLIQKLTYMPNVDIKVVRFISIIFCAHVLAALLFVMGCKRKLSHYLIPYLFLDLLTVTVFFIWWLQFCQIYNGYAKDTITFIYLTSVLGASIYLNLFAISVYQHVRNCKNHLIENLFREEYDASSASEKQNNHHVTLLYGIESKYKKLPLKCDEIYDERSCDMESIYSSNEVLYSQNEKYTI